VLRAEVGGELALEGLDLVRPRADGTVELRADVDEATIKEARLKATTSTIMTTEE